MIYEWRCKQCGEVVEIQRSIKQRRFGPTKEEAPCAHANSAGFERIISAPKSIRVQEFEHTETGKWPV